MSLLVSHSLSREAPPPEVIQCDDTQSRVRECNDILDTHLKDAQTGFMIRTNSGEFMIRDKKLIKKIIKAVARHIDGELLELGM
jgi:hypothetical protein